MKHQMYTVYDKAVGSYLPPFYVRAKGEALRSFTASVQQPDHQFAKFSADYVLFFLGEFDDNSGTFIAVEPQRIISAQEVQAQFSEVFPPSKEVIEVERGPRAL